MSNSWVRRKADSDEERFGLLDPVTRAKYKKQPVFQAPEGDAPESGLVALGVTSGVGSMLVGAQASGFRVVGNVEWRDYYRYRSKEGQPSTFPHNFPGAFMARGLADVPRDLIPGRIDFAAGHPECLPGETRIYTSKGRKAIKTIQPGDLVLTHKGRFRRVVKVHENQATPETPIIRLATSAKKGGRKFTHAFIVLTGNHPVLTSRGWVPAQEVVVGDTLFRLTLPCPRCGKPRPHYRGFCSLSCAVTGQWEQATEADRAQLLDNCHARVRELARNGEHHFYDPEVRSNAMRALSLGKNGSNLERLMAWGMEKAGLPEPVPQYPVGRFFADFAYPEHKIAIECDGVAWHNDPEKEALRDQFFESQGWTVLHFPEDRIKTDVLGCAEEVRRVLDNHEGRYGFEEVEVAEVIEYRWKNSRKVYNLTVEEDSSYVAKGFVVHNCGRFSVLSHSVSRGNYQETRSTDASDIPLFLKMIAELRPRFFLMDDLPASFKALPMKAYVDLLPDYDLFPEWISNWGYGNIQKYRNRMFVVGALKSEKFTFVPGEEEHTRTLKDVIGHLAETPPGGFPNHAGIDPDYIPGRYVNLRHYGDRPSWEEVQEFMREPDLFRKNVTYFTPEGGQNVRPGTSNPLWDEHCTVLSGGYNPLHPLRLTPLTIRERAAIQGFPDDFLFFHDERGPEAELWEPYNSDGQRGIKQTGKAMPIQFCTFVSDQVKAHIEKKPSEASGKRVLKPNDMVSQAKLEFCEASGYANQDAACEACWLRSTCHIYKANNPTGE